MLISSIIVGVVVTIALLIKILVLQRKADDVGKEIKQQEKDGPPKA